MIVIYYRFFNKHYWQIVKITDFLESCEVAFYFQKLNTQSIAIYEVHSLN